jgi:hypothetical protein
MTNEEFNRKVEFLLSRQADFEARMQHAQEAQTKDRRKLDETAEQTRNLTEGLAQLIDLSALLTNTVVDGLRTVFISMKELSESNKATDEKINVLIASHIRADEKLKRHLREDHGLSDA